MTEINPQDSRAALSQALPRMVPRENPSQETLTGALMVLTKQQEEIKQKLDRLISDAVALRATM